jgi:hypothetical protein
VRTWAIMLVSLFIFLGLRLYGITQESMWVDEVISFPGKASATLNLYIRHVLEGSPPVTPLYFILQYAWASWIADDELSLRLLPLLLESIGSVSAAFMAWRYLGKPAAVLTLLLCAVSVPNIYYALELRMYPLVLALSPCAMISAIEYARTRRPAWLATNLLVNALLVWTHVLTVVLMVLQGVFLLARLRGQRADLLQWIAGMALSMLGVAFYVTTLDMEKAKALTSWVNELSVESVLSHLTGIPAVLSQFSGVTMIVLNLFFLLGVAIYLALAHRGRIAPPPGGLPVVWLLAGWMLAPPLLLAALSVFSNSIYAPRYFVSSLYASFLLAGLLPTSLPSRGLRAAAYAGVAALLLYQGAHVLERPIRTDMRTAARIVLEQGKADDYIVIFDNFYAIPFAHYSRYPEKMIIRGDERGVLEELITQVAGGRGSLWVFESDRPASELPCPEAAMLEQLHAERFEIPGRKSEPLHLVRYRAAE